MKRMTKIVTFSAAALVAAIAMVPTTARADRFHNRDHAGRVEIDLHSGPVVYEHAPVIVDRPQQVWVEPVYQTVCDKVWHEPVVQKQVDHVWVPERHELRDVYRNGRVSREPVVTPGHYEDVSRDVVLTPGYYEDVNRQVLVAPGHWETRVQAVVVAPPPPHEGFHFDLHLPIRW